MKYNYFPLPSNFSFTKSSTFINGNWLFLLSSLLTVQSPLKFQTENVKVTKQCLAPAGTELRAVQPVAYSLWLPMTGIRTRLSVFRSTTPKQHKNSVRAAQKTPSSLQRPTGQCCQRQTVPCTLVGSYEMHCMMRTVRILTSLKILKRNTDHSHTMNGFTVHISPNYSTRMARTRCWGYRGCQQ